MGVLTSTILFLFLCSLILFGVYFVMKIRREYKTEKKIEQKKRELKNKISAMKLDLTKVVLGYKYKEMTVDIEVLKHMIREAERELQDLES